MDETGHAGRAVPASNNGTSQPGEAAQLNGWTHVSAQPKARHNGSAWSAVDAALDPATDPLSASWPGAGGYGPPPGYPDPATTATTVATATAPTAPTPVAAAAPISNGYDTAPPSGPSRTDAMAAEVPPERAASDSWVDWQSAPLPPGHIGFGEENTPPRGIPVVPPTGSPAVRSQGEHRHAEQPYGQRRGAEQPYDEHRRAEQPYDEPWHTEQPQGEQRRGEQSRAEEWPAEVLPQRVPAQPDVPPLPSGIAEEVGVRAEVPELARIATYLRHDDAPPAREAFDVGAVLAAVREVDGVRGAELRRNPNGVHTLRLDLVDGTDGGQVSRLVARLLSERMGLSAALGAPPAASQPAPTAQPAASQPAPTAQPAGPAEPPATAYQPIRRHPGSGVRGRAAVRPRMPDEDYAVAPSAAVAGAPGHAGGQAAGSPRPSRPLPAPALGMRVVLDHVQVSTFGLDATVEVRLTLGERRALGEAHGPAVDGYVLRLSAASAAAALDQLLLDPATGRSRGRCFIEHAALVPFGTGEVAVAVVLLVCDGWVEQLAGSAMVAGDPRQAVVRATLAAVNRRLESLLH